MDPYVLYAMPASLYSGKARSYLRTHRIDYVERAPGDPRYTGEIEPGHRSVDHPGTPDPRRHHRPGHRRHHRPPRRHQPPERSAYPATPVHRTVAHLLELFGGEGLLRPAMHYRWDFDDTNVAFLAKDFSAALAVGADDATRDAVFAFAIERMRARHRRLRGDRGAGARDRAVLRGVPRPASTPTWPGRRILLGGRPDHRRLRLHGPALRPPRPRPVPLGAHEAARPAGLAVGRADERPRARRPRVRRLQRGRSSPTTPCPTRCGRCSPTSARSTSTRPWPRWRPSTPGWPSTPRWPRARSCWASPSGASAAPPPSPGGASR